MKKLLLIALLFAGCGNPCEDSLTQDEQDFTRIGIGILISRGIPTFTIRADLLTLWFLNDEEECVDYLIGQAVN